jgi:stage III sporulation protein SpoIIIAA
MDNDLNKLIKNLPIFLQDNLLRHVNKDQIVEIILDLGRRPEIRFIESSEYLSQKVVSWQDIDYLTKRISKFSNQNRAGIDRTLNRISCIRNRQFLINGITCRVGRAVFGTIGVVRDLLESEKSILILGKPGVGKTTIIREIARVLADEMEKRVIVIDTANEIAGDSDIPHFGIGKARRMQVVNTKLQHQTMIEAIENHMPQVIIIDEIGTEPEVLAARTIAEKGVQLVGTTHGNCFKNLIKNPSLADLIGGIQSVTLSDDEAKRRGTQKSILERKTYPTFEIVIEINQQNYWTVYEDVKSEIDLFLQTQRTIDQSRYFFLPERIKITGRQIEQVSSFFSKNYLIKKDFFPSTSNNWTIVNQEKSEKFLKFESKNLIVYSYSLSNNLLKEILLKTGFKFILTNEVQKATLIIGSKKHLRQNLKIIKLIKQKNIPIYTFHEISFYEISKLIYFLSR